MQEKEAPQMGGNYEKGMYNQLMEVMARLDAMENILRTGKKEHREEVDLLNKKIDGLTTENLLLKDDNARLRSIINNDSSNTSLPPSTDQKGGKPANTFNGRKKTERKAGGQNYVTKYVIDLSTETVITELRIYADGNGKFPIPVQYRSDVTYGENVTPFSEKCSHCLFSKF